MSYLNKFKSIWSDELRSRFNSTHRKCFGSSVMFALPMSIIGLKSGERMVSYWNQLLLPDLNQHCIPAQQSNWFYFNWSAKHCIDKIISLSATFSNFIQWGDWLSNLPTELVLLNTNQLHANIYNFNIF